MRLENITFVDTLNDKKITTSTIILYRKKVLVREASRKKIDRVRRQVNEKDRIEK